MTTTTLSLGYRVASNKIKSKVLSLNFIKINWKLVYSLVILSAFIMLISYIFMVNQLTQGAYLIQNYNKDINVLLSENKELEASFAASSFLGDVQKRAQELNFEKTVSVKYIHILQNSLAEAK